VATQHPASDLTEEEDILRGRTAFGTLQILGRAGFTWPKMKHDDRGPWFQPEH